MISAYNRNTTVEHSEFAWMGGSAIAAWGWTDEISDGGVHGVDGTTGTFPRYTKVLYNLFHEIGKKTRYSLLVSICNFVFHIGNRGSFQAFGRSSPLPSSRPRRRSLSSRAM